MKIEHWSDDRERWLLCSGWRINPEDGYFIAPNGVIYDRCGWLLCSRDKFEELQSVQLVDIFTNDELQYCRQNLSNSLIG